MARAEDHDGIHDLVSRAFPGPEEAGLVRRLRADGVIDIELVMAAAGRIVAHLALSRLIAPLGWLALAPVAVAPDLQGKGIGTGIVTAVPGLDAIKGRTVVVLGKPSFYARCGFSLERAARLNGPYPIRNTLIARPGDDVPEETLIYPPAFDGV